MRWSMRVTSDHQGGFAEVGISVCPGRVRFAAGTPQRGEGEAHMSIDDAVELRRMLGRAIRETRAGIKRVK